MTGLLLKVHVVDGEVARADLGTLNGGRFTPLQAAVDLSAQRTISALKVSMLDGSSVGSQLAGEIKEVISGRSPSIVELRGIVEDVFRTNGSRSGVAQFKFSKVS